MIHGFKSIYKQWGEKASDILDTPIEISSAIFPGSREALNFAMEKKCILGPQYSTKKDGKNILVDWQPFVTGSPKKYESSRNAALRELAEELGVCVIDEQNNLNKITSVIVQRRRYNVLVTTFAVEAIFLHPYDSTSSAFSICECEKKNKNFFSDDKSRKVQILVFGSCDDTLKIMKQISDKLPSNDTDPNSDFWISGSRMLMDGSVLYSFCS